MANRRLQDLPPVVSNGDTPPPVVSYGIWYRSDRPKIVGLVGWLLVATGYMGFILKGSQLPSYFSDMKWLNPSYIPLPYSRGQFAAAVLILLAEMAMGLMAIAVGLGTLKLREWGRRGVVWYALIGAAFVLLKAGWQVSMFDFMLDFQASTTTQPFNREMEGNRSFFAMIVMTAAQLLWCAILASIMTRGYVKAAFARAGEPGDTGDWQSP